MKPSNPVTVGDLEPRDVAILQTMLAAAELPPAALDHPGARYIKLCDPDGEPIGFAGLEVSGRDALLRSVVVQEEQRGRGIGGLVVRHALACAEGLYAESVYLLTMTATDFFARLGFRACSRDQVPAAIRQTTEFTSLCPASAVCMCRDIRSHA